MEKSLLGKWFGTFLIITSVILLFGRDAVFDYLLKQEMMLSPGSKAYDIWSATPFPVTMDVYLFNCTNPDQLLEENFKPNLVQLGPYRFNEYHEKAKIVWNDNNTITYQQIRRWYFDAENSNGSLKDNVTMLNVLPVAASHVSRDWSNLLVYPLSAALRVVEKKIWISTTVSEMLFDGYTDPLLTIANTLPGLQTLELPVDKLGFFYGRNGSESFDGVFNMETGADDISKLGILHNWNYKNQTEFYKGKCGEIRGFAGEMFPPDRRRDSVLEMFAPDICRSVVFDFLEDTEVTGITGYKYVLGNRLFDNGTKNPDTLCNCGGDCYRQGVLNVSTCRNGAPAYVSFPHFLDADPYYSSRVVGMNPDSNKHRFHITLEPRTGLPLDLAARLQLNLLLQPNPRMSLFQDVPTILFPMIWFEERITIPPEFAETLKLLLWVPALGLYFSLSLLFLGLVFLSISVLPAAIRNLQTSHKNRKNGTTSKQNAFSEAAIKPMMIQEHKILLKSPESSTLLDS